MREQKHVDTVCLCLCVYVCVCLCVCVCERERTEQSRDDHAALSPVHDAVSVQSHRSEERRVGIAC